MQKLFYIIVLLTIPILCAEEFNFTEEFSIASETTDAIECIEACQKIAAHVEDLNSTRLAKKLVKLIKKVHTLCREEEDQKIRLSYKNLLITALSNNRLVEVDYSQELKRLLEYYEDIRMEPAPEELTNAEVYEAELEEEHYDPEIPKPAQRITKLYENVQNIDRSDTMQKLSLRRIIFDVAKLTKELNLTQQEIRRLTEQQDTVNQIYKKLSNIERFFNLNYLIKSPTPTEETEEYSPLLQKLIDLDQEV